MRKLMIFFFFITIFVVSAQEALFEKNYHGIPVLVTGGCGFIGSHLIEKLVGLGAQVTVLDNLSTGSLTNIEAVKNKIMFIHGDIRDLSVCVAAAKDKKIIFHLAAVTSVNQSMVNPQECLEINIRGTYNLLEAARINKVSRFVFSSSAAVYGNKEGACVETDTCLPMSPYGFSKMIGEYCCREYYERFGVNAICLRYFNVYGERQDPKSEYAGVVTKFTDQIKRGLPITIFGDGLQTRDFIKVEKIVEANISLGLLPYDKMTGQSCNIATGKSITLLELVEMIKKENACDNFITIQYAPERLGDIRHSRAICEKLQQLMTLSHFNN